MDQKQYFDHVNIAKLILAVAVAAMHSGFVPSDSLVMKLVCRMAVPFFFVASGFFLKNRCSGENCGEAVRQYIRRLLLPYTVFSVIWIVQLLVDDAIGGVGYSQAAVGLIQNIIFFPRGALWYVWASMIGVIMLYPALKKDRLLPWLPLGILLFMTGLLANNYYFIADGSAWLGPAVDLYLKICLVSNNAVFVGYVFLLIGMIISTYYGRIRKILSLPLTLAILAVSIVLLILEASLIERRAGSTGDGAFYLSQLIYVPAVFYLTTGIKRPVIKKEFSRIAKNLSTGIYFLHVPFLWILHRSAAYIFPHIPGLQRIAPLFDHAGICFAVCLFICTAVCLTAYKYPESFVCKILK